MKSQRVIILKIRGIANGMVMQRDKNNLCDIYFYADEPVEKIEVDDKFSFVKFEKENEKYHLSGIRTGGPYTLKINNEIFNDIYVGDLWILAGQSNNQGVGRLVDIPYNSNDKIRAFYMDSCWSVANHPLNKMGESFYKVHTEVLGATPSNFNIKGVGPGLSFAQKMFSLTGAPQGVIPCSHGGTNLFDQWDPKKLSLGPNKSLYGATYARFLDNGSNCKGVFWYQGCSDAHEQCYLDYTENMIELVKAFRRDFKENLPFVQVQISRCSWDHNEHMGDIMWTSIREQQRKLNLKIENFDTVNTVAYRLADCIHLASTSQEVVGQDAAEAMFCLIYGKLYNCKPGIKLDTIEVFSDDYDENMSSVVLTYKNVHGKLQDFGRAMGFNRSWNSEYIENCGIFDTFVDGNQVTIRCDYPKEKIIGQYLWYGAGRDNAANITDEKGRSLPAFGPIEIKEGKVD